MPKKISRRASVEEISRHSFCRTMGTDAEGGLNGLRLLLKGGGKRGIGVHAGHADRRR